MLSMLLIAACEYDEGIPETDIPGKVYLPREAVTRNTVKAVDTDDDRSTPNELEDQGLNEDLRLMGPVYIGAFSGIDTTTFAYPHPSMGPVTQENEPGNTFPYGGITVGRLDFACYESLACKVTTGRFQDYEDLLDHFASSLGLPVLDSDGNPVTDGSVFQQRCFDYFKATSDAEMSFIGEEQFVLEGDYYVADFTLNHTVAVEGMAVWGMMDAPLVSLENASTNGGFGTCNPNGGRGVTEYNHSYTEGRTYYNVLNYPDTYIGGGDWVASEGPVVHFDDDGIPGEVALYIDFIIPEGE